MEQKYPYIKLVSIQPVTNMVAFIYDRWKDIGCQYWFPPHTAIYLVKEGPSTPEQFIYVYLDNRQACFSSIVTGFCNEDPSLPIVRLSSQSPNHDVISTSIVGRNEFRHLLSCVQRMRHDADYVPEEVNQRCCDETIAEDIDFLIEELTLHGVRMSKDVELFCQEEICRAKISLEALNRAE